MKHRSAGFTLVEVLVVIVIIAILASLLIPALIGAGVQGKVTATLNTIQMMQNGLELYQTAYGDYPPTSLTRFKVEVDDINSGIESAFACLSTTQKNGPFIEVDDDYIQNVDSDAAPTNVTNWWFGDNQLREISDVWGNPLIYFHYRDYRNSGQYGKYLINGEVQTAKPEPSSKTATFPNPTSFMIWSAGPDAVNDNGGNDDVVGW